MRNYRAKKLVSNLILLLLISEKRVLLKLFHKLSGRTGKGTSTPLITFLSQDNAVGQPVIALELVMILALVMRKVQGDNLSKALEVSNAENLYVHTFYLPYFLIYSPPLNNFLP